MAPRGENEMPRTFIAVAALTVLAVPALAGFEEGKQAAMRGELTVAYEEWRPLAEKGHAESQFLLGLMYREGRAVTQDLAKSVQWLRKAAKQGHAGARIHLARVLRESLGSDQDYEEAVRWFGLAAEHGHAESAFTLALMYRNGEGVVPDDGKAARWYRVAANLGHGQARFALGAVTQSGKGVKKDLVRAYAWYSLSADSGVKLGGTFRDWLARQMSPEEVAAARALAEELRAGGRDAADPPETAGETVAKGSSEGPIAALGLTSAEARQIFDSVAESPADQGSSYRVRLAAYRSVENSRKGWDILRKANPDLFQDLEPRIHRIDFGPEKGIFYRLEAGPLADRTAAGALCAALKARKFDCLVVPP